MKREERGVVSQNTGERHPVEAMVLSIIQGQLANRTVYMQTATLSLSDACGSIEHACMPFICVPIFPFATDCTNLDTHTLKLIKTKISSCIFRIVC